MLLKFKTKRDINGNTKVLVIDDNTREFTRTLKEFSTCDYVLIKSSDRKILIDKLVKCGYKEV